MLKIGDHVWLMLYFTFSALAFYQARSLLEWHTVSRFCGFCGGKNNLIDAGRRKQCSNELCKKKIYPRVDPVCQSFSSLWLIMLLVIALLFGLLVFLCFFGRGYGTYILKCYMRILTFFWHLALATGCHYVSYWQREWPSAIK